MTTKKDIERLFRDNYTAMHRLAFRLLDDEQAAKDIVHDVFMSIMSSDKADTTPVYLYHAVRNRCLNRLRDMTVRERIHGLYAIELSEIENGESPDEAVLDSMSTIITTKLSEQCRRVLKLRFTDGMSYNEIATTLKISEVAVYKHLRHALDVLRQNLKANG